MDQFLLSKKRAQRAIQYRRVVAFSNHFHVEDKQTGHLMSYNSGVASVFQQQSENGEESTVNYVGVPKFLMESAIPTSLRSEVAFQSFCSLQQACLIAILTIVSTSEPYPAKRKLSRAPNLLSIIPESSKSERQKAAVTIK